MKEQIQTPKYLHKCGRCVFLGQFEGSDLYYCPDRDLCLARYGDKDDEFHTRRSDPQVAEAYRIAGEARNDLS